MFKLVTSGNNGNFDCSFISFFFLSAILLVVSGSSVTFVIIFFTVTIIVFFNFLLFSVAVLRLTFSSYVNTSVRWYSRSPRLLTSSELFRKKHFVQHTSKPTAEDYAESCLIVRCVFYSSLTLFARYFIKLVRVSCLFYSSELV